MKFPNPHGMHDIRSMKTKELFNLFSLIKFIGGYSYAFRTPAHLFCENSLGLIAIRHGFDSWSQPFSGNLGEVGIYLEILGIWLSLIGLLISARGFLL